MKPESHKSITRLAIEQFIKFSPGSKLAHTIKKEIFLEATLKGSNDEDNATLSRGMNWHFFPANKTIANQDIQLIPFFFPDFKLRPTTLFWIKKRQRDFIDLLQDGVSAPLFSTFGRILHHIQDMSTPSHVTPVYHGPGKADPFEEYLTQKTPVNHWQAIEKRLRGMETYFYAIQSGISCDDFSTLYNKAAKRVLDEMVSPVTLFPVAINTDHPDIKVFSDAFWIPYNGQDIGDVPLHIRGFGRFGLLGEGFGTCASYKHNDQEIAVRPSLYEDIAVHYMRSAVEDSLRALKYFDQHFI